MNLDNITKKFPIGSSVVEKKLLSAGQHYPTGKVIAIAPDGKILVELWERVYKHLPEALLTEKEAAIVQAVLDADQSKLDAEFNQVAHQIREKLEQATVLTQEALDMAKAHKKDLRPLREECKALSGVLRAGGWSASSLSC